MDPLIWTPSSGPLNVDSLKFKTVDPLNVVSLKFKTVDPLNVKFKTVDPLNVNFPPLLETNNIQLGQFFVTHHNYAHTVPSSLPLDVLHHQLFVCAERKPIADARAGDAMHPVL